MWVYGTLALSSFSFSLSAIIRSVASERGARSVRRRSCDDVDMSKARLGSLIVISMAWAGTLFLGAPGPARAQSSSQPKVLELKLTGVVDPFMASYVKRGIGAANADKDAAVLLTIDTPGGLDSSMREIIKSILASKVSVICYTAPSGARAASAGSFIMLACPVNAMAPGTEIGAAHPVGVSGAIESDKVTNDAAAIIVSLANRWGRNATLAEEFVRQSKSIDAGLATTVNVADYYAESSSALFKQICDVFTARTESHGAISANQANLALKALQFRYPCVSADTIVSFHMSVSESLFHSFADPNVAFLLLNIGFIALIVWVIHPGFHVSLGVGIVCLVLGLVILETLPVRLTGVILLLVAAVLFVLDLKAKAHGILTTAGIAVLILGGLLLFNPAVPGARVSRPLIAAVALAAGLFTFFALGAILRSKGAPVQMGLESLRGSTGVVVSPLEPRGTARVQHQTWTAETTGE